MILPVTPPSDRNAHRSGPPRGLILDAEYGARLASEYNGDETIMHAESKHAGFQSLSGQLCEISISHDGDFATAVALVPSQAHCDSGSIESEEGNPELLSIASGMPTSQHASQACTGSSVNDKFLEHLNCNVRHSRQNPPAPADHGVGCGAVTPKRNQSTNGRPPASECYAQSLKRIAQPGEADYRM